MGKMRKDSAILTVWCALPAVNCPRQNGRLWGKILSRATRTALKPMDSGNYTENKENNILSLQPEDMLSC